MTAHDQVSCTYGTHFSSFFSFSQFTFLLETSVSSVSLPKNVLFLQKGQIHTVVKISLTAVDPASCAVHIHIAEISVPSFFASAGEILPLYKNKFHPLFYTCKPSLALPDTNQPVQNKIALSDRVWHDRVWQREATVNLRCDNDSDSVPIFCLDNIIIHCLQYILTLY